MARSDRIHSDAMVEAVRYLARRERSESQVRLYLKDRGYSERGIRNTLTTLQRFGYLNDDAVALRLAQAQLQRRPLGCDGIREVLTRRGFSTETADRAVRKAYEGTTEEAVAARFLSTLPVKFKDPMREARRKAALLLARRFPEDMIEPLLNHGAFDQDP